MLSDSERQTIFDAARDTVLAGLPDAWAVYVYGSFARGEEWPESDLDIAVLLPPNGRIPDLLELVGAISERVRRNVDVVDLRRVGDVLRREVLDSGRILFRPAWPRRRQAPTSKPTTCSRTQRFSTSSGPLRPC